VQRRGGGREIFWYGKKSNVVLPPTSYRVPQGQGTPPEGQPAAGVPAAGHPSGGPPAG